ncbi:ATP:guanido phosphotransferase YacI [Desulfocucumis palustris]|uniref:Protein-arginine kinase n=1 Tax=Desulfocucumis palustris TaxID=1898651 RepID=A0A2L2XN10_9FIRM|nr:protein arginine kinase [Desulfocucumis palustris]GBF35736.1 ATP:guanido phosphotransferase YacI [Desulfocucumis palustris]
MSIKETVSAARSCWTTGDGAESDVVISSRVRVARNLAEFPFPHQLSDESAEQVIQAVSLAVNNTADQGIGILEMTGMGELTPVERQILVEKHLISPDLLENYKNKAVVLNNDESVSIMINEEDHLRLQCLLPGLQLHEAWHRLSSIDDVLEKTLDYAFDEKLGYLTACPTNVGTGIRASLMLHLPGLALVNQISGVLSTVSKLGFAVRGLYGEGTEATGNLFQISNQITLGQTEEDIIAGMVSVARQIIASERSARQALFKERREHMEDRVGRAWGILKHAGIVTSEEAMKLFSDLRLGRDLNIIDLIPPDLITELMIMTRPAFLLKMSGKDLSPFERDVQRAKLIREKLA